jgi:antitoxin HigA-1
MRAKSGAKITARDPDWLGPGISPGEMLMEEFLKRSGFGQIEAARRFGVSLSRLDEMVLGKRRITADTALRLARLFRMSPQFWMRLQADWELHRAIERQARKVS